MPEFKPFPKMPRLSREVLITEKIDGTNASIYIGGIADGMPEQAICAFHDTYIMAGSRTQWITPERDNHGFAKWVSEYAEDLKTLGPGHHFGEWWGSGIQRGYGLTKGEKRFSLFNVLRWHLAGEEPRRIPTADPRIEKYSEELPSCVGLVPLLYRGMFDTARVQFELDALHDFGSQAAPGYMNPEGVVVYHIAGNVGFKKTIHKDEEPKSLHT